VHYLAGNSLHLLEGRAHSLGGQAAHIHGFNAVILFGVGQMLRKPR
jgi:hypothetical protein